MKKNLLVIGILILLVVIAVYLNLNSQAQEERPQEGYMAPRFTVTDLEGNTVKLEDLKGKPVLINFWASWCEPCKLEMPHLQQAYEKYGDRMAFLLINAIETDDREKMLAYVKENQFTFPVYLDKKNQVSKKYQVLGYPTSFFVDREGRIVKKVLP